MESDEGIAAIAAIITALASAAGAGTGIASAVKGSKSTTPDMSAMKLPSAPATGASAEDMAAAGLMRSENLGAVSPAWKGGLEGAPTGPLPGAGSAITTPLGQSTTMGGDIGGNIGNMGFGGSADDMLASIQKYLGG